MIVDKLPIKKMALGFFLTTLILGAMPVQTEENPLKLPPEIHEGLVEGLGLLYDLKFEEGIDRIELHRAESAEHPIIAFAIASAYWWRLSVLVLEPDDEESAPFLKEIERCIELSEEKIDEGDTTGEAHLALGGAYGMWGRWEATNRNWLSAYFKGKKAYKILKKGWKINPELYDVYMGLGIFDYYVATLPKVVQILAFLGVDADRDVGLEELNKAAFHSLYAQIPSRLFLVDIHANQENNPDEALKIIATMKDDYPKSPFIHMLEFIALYNQGDIEKITASAELMLERLNDGTYVEVTRTQTYFSQAMVYFKQKKWEGAIEWLNKAIAVDHKIESFYSWSHLYKGYALDALGKRDEAKAFYKKTLKQLRRWNSHDNAKRRLKRPFTGSDEEPEMVKLRF